MEQEPERELPLDTLKRVGYQVRLAVHLVFIIAAFLLVGILLASLLFKLAV